MSAGFQILKHSFYGDTTFVPTPNIATMDKKIVFAGINNQNSNGILQTNYPSRNSGAGVGFNQHNTNVSANIARQWYDSKQRSTMNGKRGNVPKIMIKTNQTNENMQTTNMINHSMSGEHQTEEN